MGVLPLQFEDGQSWQTLGLVGSEIVCIRGIAQELKPRARLHVDIVTAKGAGRSFEVMSRIDTVDELDYFRNDGILPFVLRNLASRA